MKLTKLFIVFIITFFSFTIVNGQNVIERPNPPVLVTDLAGVLSPEQKQTKKRFQIPQTDKTNQGTQHKSINSPWNQDTLTIASP